MIKINAAKFIVFCYPFTLPQLYYPAPAVIPAVRKDYIPIIEWIISGLIDE
jgi:hypothetical protein